MGSRRVPFDLIPKFAELGIVGGTIRGYGCPGLSEVASGLVMAELARGDGSLNTFFGVHSGLAMGTIAMLGSEEQRQRWLPPMARLERIGAFGLTEPDHGSDAVALATGARRDGDTWIIDGAKKWIGNASFADVTIIWARDVADGQVKGFLVERGMPGFDAAIITGKTAKRAVWQTAITPDRRARAGGEPPHGGRQFQGHRQGADRDPLWRRLGGDRPRGGPATNMRWPTPGSASRSASRSPRAS